MVVQVPHEPVDEPGFDCGRLNIDCRSELAFSCTRIIVEVEFEVRGGVVSFGDVVSWIADPDAIVSDGHDVGSVDCLMDVRFGGM